MGARRAVEWTLTAEEDLARIHAFVLRQWGERYADRFLTLVMEFEDLVSVHPNLFRMSPMQPNLRLGIVHRNMWAVYEVRPTTIRIIAMLDTRAENKGFV